MKKLLLLLITLFAVTGIQAQSFETNDSQQLWSYFGRKGTPNTKAMGTGTTGTYYAGVYIASGDPVVIGKSIKGIRVYLRDVEHITDFKVWIHTSNRSNMFSSTLFQPKVINTVSTDQLVGGDQAGQLGTANDIMFSSAYTPTGITYVGYSFTVTDASTEQAQHPIVYDADVNDMYSLYITQPGESLPLVSRAASYGAAAIELLVSGSFTKNDVSSRGRNIGYHAGVIGEDAIVTAPVQNLGARGISSLSYTVTDVETKAVSAERTVNLDTKYTNVGGVTDVTIPVSTDASTGVREKLLTITKVNGETNEDAKKQLRFKLGTVARAVPRNYVVEEYTGTTCQYCPRGYVAMEKMKELYPERFIGIAVHWYSPLDAMYISVAEKTGDAYQQTNYAYTTMFQTSGAPKTQMNRDSIMNPELMPPAIPTTDRYASAAVDVVAEWNADKTVITATSTLETLIDDGDTYTIEYVLVGDGLTGTDHDNVRWSQTNTYYSGSQAYDYIDISPFCKDGKWGSNRVAGLVFNDVALLSSYKDGVNTATAPGKLAINTPVTNTFTFNFSDINANCINEVDKEQLYVVAMLINSKGEVVNAARYNPSKPTGIKTVNRQSGESVEVARYTLDGRRISAPQRGVNIIKMSDGTTIKKIEK